MPASRSFCLALLTMIFTARIASARIKRAAGCTPPDGTPSIKVGVVIYARLRLGAAGVIEGLEALQRFDHLKPTTALDSQARNRTRSVWLTGSAPGSVSSSMPLDYDGQTFDNLTPPPPKQSPLAVSGRIGF